MEEKWMILIKDFRSLFSLCPSGVKYSQINTAAPAVFQGVFRLKNFP